MEFSESGSVAQNWLPVPDKWLTTPCDYQPPIFIVLNYNPPLPLSYGALCHKLSGKEINEVKSESEEIWRITGFSLTEITCKMFSFMS